MPRKYTRNTNNSKPGYDVYGNQIWTADISKDKEGNYNIDYGLPELVVTPRNNLDIAGVINKAHRNFIGNAANAVGLAAMAPVGASLVTNPITTGLTLAGAFAGSRLGGTIGESINKRVNAENPQYDVLGEIIGGIIGGGKALKSVNKAKVDAKAAALDRLNSTQTLVDTSPVLVRNNPSTITANNRTYTNRFSNALEFKEEPFTLDSPNFSENNSRLLAYKEPPEIVEPEPIVLSSSGKTIKLGNQEYNDNYSFIRKFNKWNRHYGYPMLKYDLAKDTEALNAAIQNRMNQHNTFARGVRVEHNNQNYSSLVEKLRKEGIEPTDDAIMEYLATHYLSDTGHGRSGVNDWTVGTSYNSNAIDQAVGYATNGSRRNITNPLFDKYGYYGKNHGNIYITRKPTDFSGNREDWVINNDFSFNKKDADLYQKYKLPYLMKYGETSSLEKPIKESILSDVYEEIENIDFTPYNHINNYNDFKKNLSVDIGHGNSLLGETILNKALSSPKTSLSDSTPYQRFRLNKIYSDIRNNIYKGKETRNIAKKYENEISDYINKNDNIFNIFGVASSKEQFKKYLEGESNFMPDDVYDYLLTNEEFQKNIATQINKTFNKFNQKVVDDYYRKRFKEIQKETKSRYIKQRIQSNYRNINKEQYYEASFKELGLNPAKVNKIITSEQLTKNKKNPFQHFIFTGKAGDKALEIVKKVPYDEWKYIFGTRNHVGTWKENEGLSRKSYKNGGVMYNDRPKLFWGAAISGLGSGLSTAATGASVGSMFGPLGTGIGAGVGGAIGLISGIFGHKSKEKQLKKEAAQQDFQNRIQTAAQLNAAAANTEYADAYRDRFTFKLGGNVSPQRYKDRFCLGGRKH